MVFTDKAANIAFIKDRLEEHGFDLTAAAMNPLERVPFEKLHEIHDHEEHFLRTTFVASIIEAHTSRSAGSEKITTGDVRGGMRLLGRAVQRAPESTFNNKRLFGEVCPYCR